MQSEYLDVKSSSTRDMLAAQGSSLIVICPGIHTLVIGRANSKQPLCIPHCIAYATNSQGPSTKSTAPEPSPSTSSDASEQAAQSLRLQPMLQKYRAKRHSSVTSLPQPSPNSLAVDWVNVTEVEVEGGGKRREPRWVVGEDALSVHPEDGYDVVWPMRELASRPIQQVKDDLEKIWRGALSSHNGMKQSDITGMAAVLVLPAKYEAPLVRLLVDLVLTHLGCTSVVVHLQPAALAFGQGVTSTCLLHIGIGSSWVCCVEDGCVLPNSHIALPYGQHHVAMVLLRLLKGCTGFPSQEQLDPEGRPCDWGLLQQLLLRHCFMAMEGETSVVEQQVMDAGAAEITVHGAGGGKAQEGVQVVLGPLACVAPMAVFFPQMFKDLAVTTSNKDVESGRMAPDRWEVESCTPQELHYASLLAACRPDVQQHPGAHYYSDLVRGEPEAEDPPSQRLMGVDEAILRSIRTSAGSVEQKLRLFQSIVVSGPGAGVKGCADMLERRVLHCLPEEETDVEVVAVLEPREDTRFMSWRGGVLLGTLDTRDNWVTREEWQAGGAKVGRPSKMARSDNPNARLFYYCRAQQGV